MSISDITKDLWLVGDDLTTITMDSSNKVSEWRDRSGNNRHATQTTESLKPTYISNGSVYFSGSYFNVNLDWLANSSHMAFIVTKNLNYAYIYGAKTNSGNNNNKLHVGFASSTSFGVNYWNDGHTPTISNTSYLDIGYNLLSFKWMQGSNRSAFSNGIQNGTNSATAPAIGLPSGGGIIGSAIVGTIANYNGFIKEIIFLTNTNITDSNINTINSYLMTKYNLNTNLTIAPLKNAGQTATQLKAAGYTLNNLVNAGFTATELKLITPPTKYNIYDIPGQTLTYSNEVTSTTLFTNTDDGINNIDVSAKNFYYFNLVTSQYEKYNTIRISTNGWLGFTSSIGEVSSGKNNNSPINTIRFFSFDARSTIKYYFDSNNNLFISSIGAGYSYGNAFDIVIKIEPTNVISVYYKSIGESTGSATNKAIIGWVGNINNQSTDDNFYMTFNGSTFLSNNRTDINGKYLVFDIKTDVFTLTELKTAGYTETELKAAGYTATELKPLYTLTELKTAGYTANELRTGGFTATELITEGFTLAQLKTGGFTATELKSLYTLTELINAGFTATELRTGGFTATELKTAGFTANELKTAGFTATELKTAGFTLAELKSAGFTATQLKTLYTLTELINVGFTATELKTGGFTATELKTAGFTATELITAGFTASELKTALFTASELKTALFTASELKTALFTASELKTGGFNASELKTGGFNASELKTGGFTATELRTGGFAATELKTLYTLAELKTAGFTATELKLITPPTKYNIYDMPGQTLTYSSAVTSTTLFTNTDTLTGDIDVSTKNFYYFNLVTNKYEKYNTICISSNGWLGFKSSISESSNGTSTNYPTNTIRFFSFDAKSTIKYYFDSNNNLFISSIGTAYFGGNAFTIVIKIEPTNVISIYYQSIGTGTNKPIIGWVGNINYQSTDDNIYMTFNGSATFNQSNINGKYLVFDIKHIFTASELKTAGYTAAELKNAGYTLAELKSAGYTLAELKSAGYTAPELKSAGYTLAELKTEGFTATELRSAAFTATELKPLYTLDQLKTGGFTAIELKPLYTLDQLKAEGFTATELKTAGFTLAELKTAGFVPMELRTAGFVPTDLKNAGFLLSEIKTAGFTIEELIVICTFFSKTTSFYNSIKPSNP
jgi:ribosomal protein L13E